MDKSAFLAVISFVICIDKLHVVHSSKCPDKTFDFVQSVNDCFYVSKVAMSFEMAYRTCQEKGMTMQYTDLNRISSALISYQLIYIIHQFNTITINVLTVVVHYDFICG